MIIKNIVQKIKNISFFRRWMLSETACKANAFGMTYLGEIDLKRKKNAKEKKLDSKILKYDKYFG